MQSILLKPSLSKSTWSVRRALRLSWSQVERFSTFPCLQDPSAAAAGPRAQGKSILFYGSDDFSLASLTMLRRAMVGGQMKQDVEDETIPLYIDQLVVVTTSHRNPVSHYCDQVQLRCHLFTDYHVPCDRFDLGVVSSFGRLIQAQAIERCRHGMLNIHGSLLPRWRGASPIQHAILHDDPRLGLTIMRVAPKHFDTGDVVAQRSIAMPPRLTAMEAKRLLAPMGSQLLRQVLVDLERSLEQAKPQAEVGVTYAPKLRPQDGELDWAVMQAQEVDRRYRAFTGFLELYTFWHDGGHLKLADMVEPELVAKLELDALSSQLTSGTHCPGLVWYHRKRHLLCIACAQGWVAFRSATMSGRKRMSALGFYNTFMRPVRVEAKASGRGEPRFLVGNQWKVDENL